MKRIKYYILLLASVGCFSACTSWLDEDPVYSQNNAVVFSSRSNAELALLGCYGYMTTTGAYGQMWQELPIIASGFAFGQRTASTAISLEAVPSDDLIPIAWNGMYKVVTEVNAFLESLDKSSLSDTDKVQMGGEAKFLRGLAYYNLVSLFGDVPLKTAASSSDGISVPRSPQAEVLALVVQDMKDAMAIDSKIVDGRANSWAAKAFLGKVYYKMACLGIDETANWTNAKNMFDDVYEAHIFDLEPKFGDLFGDYVTGSKEAIFQLNFTTSSTVCFNRASNRFAPPQATTGISWGTYKASKAAYDLHEGTYPGDPRINETFLTRWRNRSGNNQANPKPTVGDVLSPNNSTYLYPYFAYVNGDIDEYVMKNGVATKEKKKYVGKLPYKAFIDPKNPTIETIENYASTHGVTLENVAITKCLKEVFVKTGSQNAWPCFQKLYDQNQVGTASHKNLMVYRYAEMLLLMADVYNELGDTPKAISLAKEVLNRARNSGMKVSAQPADWPTSLNQEEVRQKLFFERIIELCGEPGMYEMPRIRGTKYFKMALELHNNHEITIASDALYPASSNAWLDRIYNGTRGLTDEFLKKNLLLPIPSSEIDANPALTTSDNNFGYTN